MNLKPFSVKQAISYHADFYAPAEVSQDLLLSLHGNAQSKEVALKLALGIRKDWHIAALQAPYPHVQRTAKGLQTVFGWVSDFEPKEAIENHHKFITSVIDQAFKDGLIKEKKAYLFGFSQSVSLNYRFAKVHPNYLKGVIAVAGAAPSDWALQPQSLDRLSMPILHICPTEDEAYPLTRARQFKEKLATHFENLTWHEEAGGHRVPRASYKVMKRWLDAN